MKITYINKDFISEGFIKTVDKMKSSLDKKLTADDIRKETKNLLINSILKNREFLSKCEPCFTQYIYYKAGASSPVLNFKYVDLRDGVLRVICDVQYSNIKIHERDNIFWIDDTEINKYSIKEVNNEIDDYCTKCMLQNFKKNQPEVLEYVERIHIERINFWPGHKDIDGEFPKQIFLKIISEFDQKKMLNEIEFNELLNKVNALFSFCARTVLVDKPAIRVKEHKDKLASDVAALLDASKCSVEKQQKITRYARLLGSNIVTTFDEVSLANLTRKDLHEFTVVPVIKQIDLHKYLINNNIKWSTVKEKMFLDKIHKKTVIITTASYSRIEQVKDYLVKVYNRQFSESNSGDIEYLAYVVDNSDVADGIEYSNVMDFVDGEYHNFYTIALKI